MAEGSLFIRLLEHEDKCGSLTEKVEAIRQECSPISDVQIVDPECFRQVPNSPFAYWVGSRVRHLFSELAMCESEGREIRCGMGTLDDFRFLRTWWEVSVHESGRSRGPENPGATWFPYAKGGGFARFYSPIPLVVNFHDNGKEVKEYVAKKVGSASRKIQAESYYFRPGITWSRRSQLGLSLRALPSGCIIADKGPAVFADKKSLPGLLGLMNSTAFRYLVSFQVAFGSYEVGVIQRTPLPSLIGPLWQRLGELARSAATLSLSLDTSSETSHDFRMPSLFQTHGVTLAERVVAWQSKLLEVEGTLHAYSKEADDIALALYGLGEIPGFMNGLSENLSISNTDADQESVEEAGDVPSSTDHRSLIADSFSYLVGCVFGRWDLRIATGERPTPGVRDVFDPLPICSPGMLLGLDGLPSIQTPDDYPLRIDWDGILVDDSDHSDDIIRRVRDVLEVIWKDRADAIEKEACEILGVAELRDYFRKPGAGGFWDDHVKRYSKSRRKAPIYWLLQSSKKNYALWVYYHRLDKDILFKALLNYVEPKIRKEEARLGELRSQKAALGPAAKGGKKLDKEIDRQEAFLSELRDFEDKLRRAANLHLDPDLNDGVVLNIAPLHELVPWKEAKSYWVDLMDGKYEWSSIGKQLREKGLVK